MDLLLLLHMSRQSLCLRKNSSSEVLTAALTPSVKTTGASSAGGHGPLWWCPMDHMNLQTHFASKKLQNTLETSAWMTKLTQTGFPVGNFWVGKLVLGFLTVEERSRVMGNKMWMTGAEELRKICSHNRPINEIKINVLLRDERAGRKAAKASIRKEKMKRDAD